MRRESGKAAGENFRFFNLPVHPLFCTFVKQPATIALTKNLETHERPVPYKSRRADQPRKPQGFRRSLQTILRTREQLHTLAHQVAVRGRGHSPGRIRKSLELTPCAERSTVAQQLHLHHRPQRRHRPHEADTHLQRAARTIGRTAGRTHRRTVLRHRKGADDKDGRGEFPRTSPADLLDEPVRGPIERRKQSKTTSTWQRTTCRKSSAQ